MVVGRLDAGVGRDSGDAAAAGPGLAVLGGVVNQPNVVKATGRQDNCWREVVIANCCGHPEGVKHGTGWELVLGKVLAGGGVLVVVLWRQLVRVFGCEFVVAIGGFAVRGPERVLFGWCEFGVAGPIFVIVSLGDALRDGGVMRGGVVDSACDGAEIFGMAVGFVAPESELGKSGWFDEKAFPHAAIILLIRKSATKVQGPPPHPRLLYKRITQALEFLYDCHLY